MRVNRYTYFNIMTIIKKKEIPIFILHQFQKLDTNNTET